MQFGGANCPVPDAKRQNRHNGVAMQRVGGIQMSGPIETITLGGGCFWCTEAVYEKVEGVTAVESGYTNGQVVRPSYEQVCAGNTGHAEVVKVSFDPSVIGLREILEIFFVIHDPTSLNRQGNDVGTQYRSGVYFESPEQEKVARTVMAEMAESGTYRKPLATEVVPLSNYSKAEAYHQHYFANNPDAGYRAFVVAPKVEKFRKTFASRVKA
jgi:peptide-methionine (S)-S-oxide reductase